MSGQHPKKRSNRMSPVRRAYLELHIAVLLWGFTAILGELIQLSALVLVWWRVLLTSLSLVFLVRLGNMLREMPLRKVVQFAFVGVLTGLHWLTFYGSIKLANASVALICMATCAFFTSLVEPILLRQPFKKLDMLFGFIVVPGMALIVEHVDTAMHVGVWVGLLSSFLAAVFSILNKKWVHDAPPMRITFIEMTSAWLFLSLVLPVYFHFEPAGRFWPSWFDLGWLLVLSVMCTTFTWMLALRALKHLSAFASTLTVNLEPVYGILLAIVVLQEHRELSPGFYWGCVLVLAVVLAHPLVTKHIEKRTAKI